MTIEERTRYPNDFSFDFKVRGDGRPVTFTLAIRKPAWAKKVLLGDAGLNAPVPYIEADGYILVTRNWGLHPSIHLEFCSDGIQTRQDRTGAVYFTDGPLVLAHPIASTGTITKRYPLPGFYDYSYRPDSLVRYTYRGGAVIQSQQGGVSVSLYDPVGNKEVSVPLVPMGGTILRQVTFPKAK